MELLDILALTAEGLEAKMTELELQTNGTKILLFNFESYCGFGRTTINVKNCIYSRMVCKNGNGLLMY